MKRIFHLHRTFDLKARTQQLESSDSEGLWQEIERLVERVVREGISEYARL